MVRQATTTTTTTTMMMMTTKTTPPPAPFSARSYYVSLGWGLMIVVTWLGMMVPATRADRNQPHPHRGLLTPYRPGSFAQVTLSAAERAQLAAGQAVMKQTVPSSSSSSPTPAGGGAWCIQDVQASKAVVWQQILDFHRYPQKVPKVVHCHNYQPPRQNRNGTVTIKTKMVLGVLPGYAYESYYDHTYHPQKDSLTWTLDYDKTSDFDDVAGHWHVQDLPPTSASSSSPPACRVFYACDIKLKGHVPGPILNYLSQSALKTATGWVKRESEKQQQQSPPQPAAPRALPLRATTARWSRSIQNHATSSSSSPPPRRWLLAFWAK